MTVFEGNSQNTEFNGKKSSACQKLHVLFMTLSKKINKCLHVNANFVT